MNENLFKLEAEIEEHDTHATCRADRNKRDVLLKMATGILTLQDVITEKQDSIREQAIIEMTDEGTPTVSGFRDDDYVELLQQQIEVLTNNRDELQAIVDESEEAFAKFGLLSMSMESLNLCIDEARWGESCILNNEDECALREEYTEEAR